MDGTRVTHRFEPGGRHTREVVRPDGGRLFEVNPRGTIAQAEQLLDRAQPAPIEVGTAVEIDLETPCEAAGHLVAVDGSAPGRCVLCGHRAEPL